MPSWPATDWIVTHVDADQRSRSQPYQRARVLLGRSVDAERLVFPTFADRYRIHGHEVMRSAAEENPVDVWQQADPVPWQRGKWPCFASDGGVQFVDPDEVDRRKRREAREAVASALAGEGDELANVARLERLDQILEGSAVVRAAMVCLWDALPASSRALLAERREDLLVRLRRASTRGEQDLRTELNLPGFEGIPPDLVRQLQLAALDAFDVPACLGSDSWPEVAMATRWAWWIRGNAAHQRVTLGELARRWHIEPTLLRNAANGVLGGASSALASGGNGVPQPTDAALQQLYEGAHDSLGWRAMVFRGQKRRLHLFSTQLATLERHMQGGRLPRWSANLRPLTQLARRVATRPENDAWRVAEWASIEVRQALGIASSDPVDLESLIGHVGAEVAGATLTFHDAWAAWTAFPGELPLVLLAPASVQATVGGLRFSVARQLGLTVLGLGKSEYERWGLGGAGELDDPSQGPAGVQRLEEPGGADWEDAFASAFAVYLLAPRSGVRQAISNQPTCDDEAVQQRWYCEAADTVARQFGLSAGAALAHVVNCGGLPGTPSGDLIRGLRSSGVWLGGRAREINARVEQDGWYRDAAWIRQQVGVVEQTATQAVARPSSARFDRLVDEARVSRAIDEETAEALRGHHP